MNNLTRDRIALDVFASHLLALDKVADSHSGMTWKASVYESLKKYLGKNSAFTQLCYTTPFTTGVKVPVKDGLWKDSTITKQVYNEKQKEKFRLLLNQVIEHIKIEGVDKAEYEIGPKVMPLAPPVSEKVEKHNWLCAWSNGQLLTGAVFVVGAAAGLCVWFYNLGQKVERGDKSEEFTKVSIESNNLKQKVDQQAEFIKQHKEVEESLANYGEELRQRNERQKNEIDSLTALIPKRKLK